MEESLGGNPKILARVLNPRPYGYHEALGTTKPNHWGCSFSLRWLWILFLHITRSIFEESLPVCFLLLFLKYFIWKITRPDYFQFCILWNLKLFRRGICTLALMIILFCGTCQETILFLMFHHFVQEDQDHKFLVYCMGRVLILIWCYWGRNMLGILEEPFRSKSWRNGNFYTIVLTMA